MLHRGRLRPPGVLVGTTLPEFFTDALPRYSWTIVGQRDLAVASARLCRRRMSALRANTGHALKVAFDSERTSLTSSGITT